MAINTWSSAGDTDGNAVGNWSLGALNATDVLTFDATSTVNCTFSGDITCAGWSMAAGYTGTIGMNTRTFTCTGNWTTHANATISAGASLINLTGTAAQTFTSAGKTYYDITINRSTAGTCLFSGATSLHTLTVSATNTMVVSWTGTTMSASGNITFAGSGTHHWGNAITLNGASSNFSVASTITGQTSTACTLTMNCSTAGKIILNKTLSTNMFVSIIINGVVSNEGGSALYTLGSGDLFKMTAGSSYSSLYSSVYIYASAITAAINIGAGCTINGTVANVFILMATTTDMTINLSAMTFSGTTQGITVYAGGGTSTFTVNLTGAISMTGILDFPTNYASSMTFTTNNYSVTCSNLRFGAATATVSGTYTLNAGSSAFSCASFNDLGANGGAGSTTIINMSTSTWYCTVNWYFGSNYTINAGTSLVNFTGTAAQTITSNGKSFYDVTINRTTAGTLTFADAAGLHTLTISATNTQAVSWSTTTLAASSTITALGSGSYAFGTTSCAIFFQNAAASTVTLSGNLTITAGGSFTKASGTFTAGLLYVIFAESGTIACSNITSRLRTAIAGSVITWDMGGDKWTVPAYAAGDWGPAAGADVAWRSIAAGNQYKISAPAGIVVTNMNPQDCNNVGTEIDASDYSSTDGGNNIGWKFALSGSQGYYKYW